MADHRHTSAEAKYEELEGAHKDADCSEVNVPGGISLEKGCCAEWKRESRYVQKFICGTCQFQLRKVK